MIDTTNLLGCIFLFQECLFLGLCFSFLPGFLRIPWNSCFFRRNFFTGTSFWLDSGIPNYSGISGILRNSCSRQPKLPWFDTRPWRRIGVGDATAHIMGCGERTPSTQYIAVTLTSRATRRCAGSWAYVHHSPSDFTISGVTSCMHNINRIINNNSNLD